MKKHTKDLTAVLEALTTDHPSLNITVLIGDETLQNDLTILSYCADDSQLLATLVKAITATTAKIMDREVH